MGEIYEVVIFTASLSKYADPVLDQLDIHRVVQHRLFRESCYNNKGNYVKVRFSLFFLVLSLALLGACFVRAMLTHPSARAGSFPTRTTHDRMYHH